MELPRISTIFTSSRASVPLHGIPGRDPATCGLAFDPQKNTILIFSHEASGTGAPILALNLVQRFSERYNVIGLILGGEN